MQPAATRCGPLLRVALAYYCAAARSYPLRPAAAHLVAYLNALTALKPAATRCGPLLRVALAYYCAEARSYPLRPAAAHLGTLLLRCSPQLPAAARCCASRRHLITAVLKPAATRNGPLLRISLAHVGAAAHSNPLRPAAARSASLLLRCSPQLPAAARCCASR